MRIQNVWSGKSMDSAVSVPLSWQVKLAASVMHRERKGQSSAWVEETREIRQQLVMILTIHIDLSNLRTGLCENLLHHKTIIG